MRSFPYLARWNLTLFMVNPFINHPSAMNLSQRLPVRRVIPSLIWLCVLLISGTVFGQASTVYTEAWRTYKKAEKHYQEQLLSKAQREYKEVVDMLLPVHQPEAELLRMKSELNYAKIAVRLDKAD
ncbi:MAG: hypothetical protein AAFP02_23005, partial [Bacteroidota bacterium]